MKLSTRTRYGLRLLIDLAKNYEKGPLQLSEIAKIENVSEKYLGQIVIILKNNKIIESVRGSQGGYYLTKSPEQLNIKDLVEILEGDLDIVECVDNNKNCEKKNGCVTRIIWSELSNAIKNTLSQWTLQDLVLMEKDNKNNMFYI